MSANSKSLLGAPRKRKRVL